MKNHLFKFSLINVLLAAALFMMSCAETAPNKPPANNASNNASNSAANNTVQNNTNQTEPDENCDGDKVTLVTQGMEAKINAKNNLKYQYKTNFDFKAVADANNNVTVYIWGKFFTDKRELDELNKTYKGFVKRGCIAKVIFDQEPTIKTLDPGFEYSLCEAPNKVCSDGSCREPQSCP